MSEQLKFALISEDDFVAVFAAGSAINFILDMMQWCYQTQSDIQTNKNKL